MQLYYRPAELTVWHVNCAQRAAAVLSPAENLLAGHVWYSLFMKKEMMYFQHSDKN